MHRIYSTFRTTGRFIARRCAPPVFGYAMAFAVALSLVPPNWAAAQSSRPALAPSAPGAPAAVDSLVAYALTVHPSIRAARDRVDAARAAVGPADVLPDPMLSAGVMNVPLGGHTGGDMTAMRMNTIGIGQTFPYPGKLALRRRVAAYELAAAEARLVAARWTVSEEVRTAYYNLVFFDRALDVVRRNAGLLQNFVSIAETRYGVGTGGQQDVLKARVEAARLAEEAVALVERRAAALARLNAALDRPSGVEVANPEVPERIARAAVPASAAEVRFVSATLGARAAGSPLPPLIEMQERAVRQSPILLAHDALIAAQAARVELAAKQHLPDFNVSVQYGQRNDRPDMVSAMVSVPLPLRKGQKQDVLVTEARARLSALEAERHERANNIRAAVATAYADLERERAQLGLFIKSIIPQGRASLESATSGFQVGRVDFLTLLENQATLFNYETAYYRSLTAFAERLAGLDRALGEEIIR